MDRNYKIDMVDMTCRVGKMDYKFKRYFSYVFIALILSCVMLLVVGCGKDKAVESNSQVAPLVEQTQSSTIKYDTPFIEFNYPSDFEVDNESIKAHDSVIAYKNKDDIKLSVIKIVSNLNLYNNSDKMINYIINQQLKDINHVITIPSSNLGNIKFFETIIYEGSVNKLHRFYAWDDGKGKIYQVDIYGNESNKDGIQNVIKVFENSIKFKQ